MWVAPFDGLDPGQNKERTELSCCCDFPAVRDSNLEPRDGTNAFSSKLSLPEYL